MASSQEQRKIDITEHKGEIYYSSWYTDDNYEYRHVSLPKQIAKYVPKRLMDEVEWRALGVQQSPGWVQYMIHGPEPHILLFRREKDYQKKYPNKAPQLSVQNAANVSAAAAAE